MYVDTHIYMVIVRGLSMCVSVCFVYVKVDVLPYIWLCVDVEINIVFCLQCIGFDCWFVSVLCVWLHCVFVSCAL